LGHDDHFLTAHLVRWVTDVFNHPDLRGSVIIAAKTTVVYLFLVFGLRILGKRELGQMTIYDVVLLIVLANSVQNSMVGQDTTLCGGLIAGGVLLSLNKLFNLALGRSMHLRAVMVGEPRLILNNGHLIYSHMAKEGITKDQVMAALREHGLSNLEQAQIAVLEVDGSISVVPADAGVLHGRRHFRALRLS
jgi:uncharacterized membrane protein YcaP (DUF421 family)